MTQEQQTTNTTWPMDLSQKKTLLALDAQVGAFDILQSIHKRKVRMARTVEEASLALRGNPENYSVFLVEPFICFQRPKELGKLQKLMLSVKEGKGLPQLPVWAYATMPKEIVEQEFGLYQGKHYDFYLYKIAPNAFNILLDAP